MRLIWRARQAYFGHSEMSPPTTMVVSVTQPLWALAALLPFFPDVQAKLEARGAHF